MEQQVARFSEEKRELLSTVGEDAVTKSSVQQIIYDIEREAQGQIARLLEENGMRLPQPRLALPADASATSDFHLLSL